MIDNVDLVNMEHVDPTTKKYSIPSFQNIIPSKIYDKLLEMHCSFQSDIILLTYRIFIYIRIETMLQCHIFLFCLEEIFFVGQSSYLCLSRALFVEVVN